MNESRLHVLLLPGLLNDPRLWEHQVAALSDIADAEVADLTQADNIPELAEQVLARAPAGPFALAGLSMGGYVALEVIRQAPERVAALALLDTTARPDSAEATAGRLDAIQRAETDLAGVVADLLPKLIHPARLDDRPLVQVITDMALSLGKNVFVRQQTAIMGRMDSRPFLNEVNCPTLILCGRDDAITPVEVHREMADSIKGANLVVLDECGHLSALERPEAVAQALRQWLGRWER
jgi:pimeloyl-ACP methyl ester carboxylesterase